MHSATQQHIGLWVINTSLQGHPTPPSLPVSTSNPVQWTARLVKQSCYLCLLFGAHGTCWPSPAYKTWLPKWLLHKITTHPRKENELPSLDLFKMRGFDSFFCFFRSSDGVPLINWNQINKTYLWYKTIYLQIEQCITRLMNLKINYMSYLYMIY